jgi:Skp family chaperone for outer membrane proteins
MKPLFIAVIAAVLGSTFSLAVVGQAQTAKTPSAVAFVSATRVYAETSHGRSEAARVQTMQQQKALDLRAKQQALTATQQELMAAAVTARAALQEKETQQRAELERATQQANADLQALQREVNQDLQRRVRAVLDDLMKTQSYLLVLNSDASLMWSSPELDLTNAVVSRMNGQP